MRKRHKSTHPVDPIAQLAELINERHRMLWDLFAGLGTTIQTYERRQERFRTAVLFKLAKIEGSLGWILTGQVAQNNRLEIWDSDKFEAEVKEIEKRISESSHQIGVELLKFVYTDLETAAPPKKGRKSRKSAL
jgi:hypothetical protein